MEEKYYIIQQLPSGKWTITYNPGTENELTEHYAYADGVPVVEIKEGYTLKEK